MRTRLPNTAYAKRLLQSGHTLFYAASALGAAAILEHKRPSNEQPQFNGNSVNSFKHSLFKQNFQQMVDFNKPKANTAFDKLSAYLADGTHRLNAFALKLHESSDELSADEVISLALTAIHHGHARELDVLSSHFADLLSAEFIKLSLLREKTSDIFRELLIANASGELQQLSYLFDPNNSVVIVEEDDKQGIKNIADANSSNITILVNSEKYASNHVVVSQAKLRSIALSNYLNDSVSRDQRSPSAIQRLT